MAALIVGPFFEPYLWGLSFRPLPLYSLFYWWAALGGYLIGKTVSRHRLLRPDGLPELGIAAFAMVFVLLLKISPSTYVPPAQLAVTSLESFLQVAFAFIVLIGPTTLVGGTPPVLSSVVSSRAKTAESYAMVWIDASKFSPPADLI